MVAFGTEVVIADLDGASLAAIRAGEGWCVFCFDFWLVGHLRNWVRHGRAQGVSGLHDPKVSAGSPELWCRQGQIALGKSGLMKIAPGSGKGIGGLQTEGLAGST